MRRRAKSNPGHTPVLNFLSIILPLISIILLVLAFVAGVHPKALTQLYYYKVNTEGLSLPSKLSDSQILQDLSSVSGTDLVGQNVTAESLKLAAFYTIHLLTSCAHSSSGEITCTTPKFGYIFDPRIELHLDATSLQGKYSDTFTFEVSQYEKISPFVAGAHDIAIGLTFLAMMIGLFASRRPTLALCVALMSWIATFLGLAASIAEIVGAVRFVKIFNDEFETAAGLRADIGNLFILPIVAAVLSLITSIILSIRYRCAKQYKRSLVRGSLTAGFLEDDKDGAPTARSIVPPGPESPTKAMRPLRLLQRIPTWGKKHNYTKVEKQPAVASSFNAMPPDFGHRRSASYQRRRDDDRAVLMMDPAGEEVMGEEEDIGAMKRMSSGSGSGVGSPHGRARSPAPPALRIEPEYAAEAYDPYTSRSREAAE